MNDMSLVFDLTVNEANVVITALAKLPFEQVAGLINKIQQQANAQLSPEAEG